MSSLQTTQIGEVAGEPGAAKDYTWPWERSTSNGQVRHISAMYTSPIWHILGPSFLFMVNSVYRGHVVAYRESLIVRGKYLDIIKGIVDSQCEA